MKFFHTSLLCVLTCLFIAGVSGNEAKGAPVINNMAPNPVPGKAIDQAVGIFGSGFVSGSALKVRVKWPTGQTDLQGSQVNFVSSTQLTIFINVGTSAANWTAQVINPNGQTSNLFSFSVTAAAPTISSVSPGSYPPLNGNQTMTINGSNFMNGATLTFDPPTGSNINSTASKLTFVSSSQISYQFNNASDVGTWTVRVNNPNGQSSNTVSFTVASSATIPGAPRNLDAYGDDRKNYLGWQAPASNGGAAITRYRVFRSTNGSGPALVTSGGCANLGVIFACTDTGLNNGQAYTYFVSADNSVGTGPPSNSKTATPIASTPTISNVSPGSYPPLNGNQTMTINGSNFVNGATLTFDPPTGSNINSTASKLTFVSSSQISYQFNNASDVGTWTVRVNNPNGQSSNTVSFTVASSATIPGAPRNLDAYGDDRKNYLGWQAPASNGGATITRYRVFRSTNGSGPALVTSGGCANLGVIFACTDTGLNNGQAYTYFVSADNSVGTGPPSNSKTATPIASTLTISSVSPNPVPGSNSSQTFTINGSGFNSSSTVTLRSPFQTYPNQPTTSKTANQIVMQVNLGTTAAQWTVEVLNGSQSSGQFPFQVSAPGTFILTNNAPVCDTNPPVGPAVRLNWNQVTGATYDVFRNGNLYYSGIAGTTFYNNLNVTAGQTFTFFIRARGTFGTRDSNQISINIPGNICGATGIPTVSSYNWNSTPTNLQNFSGSITGSNFALGTRVFFCVNGTNTCYEHPQAGVVVGNSSALSVSNVNLGTGSYQVYVQTNAGASNKSASFTVGTNTSPQPMLSVNPSSGALGTKFNFTGSNFTRNSTATLRVIRPNGTQAGTGNYATDSNGNVSFNITSQPADSLGTWTFVLTDTGGKQDSDTAQYTSSQPTGTDAVSFIADVTIPDNAQVVAGSTFEKKWRLKNIGTTTWNGYSAVFVPVPSNGNPSVNLNAVGSSSASVPAASPGQTIDVSISMKAPSPGTYYSYWQLQNASGGRFGLQFYVKIRVVPKQTNTLGFGTQTGRLGSNDSPAANWLGNADPVNTATGNYNYASTDLRVPGRGLDVEIARSYNSQDGTVGPMGTGWSHTFNLYLTNMSSSSATLHYSDGKMLDYVNQPGTSNFKSSYPGVYDELTKNADGTWTLKKTDQRKYQFDSAGRLVGIQDRNNNQISLTHSGGNLTQAVDTVGRAFTFTYSGSLVTSIVDPIGRTLLFTYDANSNLVVSRDANGNTNTYSYDDNNRLTRIVDGRSNNLLVNVYGTVCPTDITSCVATQTNGRGNKWTFTYNPDGSTSVLDPLNKESKYVQDVNFNIQQTQDRNANSQFASGLVNWHYDESNNRDQISDQKGNPTGYVYDQNGNIVSRTDPTLTTRQAVYDSNNNPKQITDELGKTTQMAYDAKGNLITLTDALSNSASTTYDAFGQTLTVTDSNGNITTRTYDARGNLTSVKDALNNITTYAYDTVGRRTSMTDARGKITRYTYDSNDNVLTVTDPVGLVTAYSYDGNNNRVLMRDPRGNTTTYAYDENNLLIGETDPKGALVQHTYDKLDRRISTRDKRGNVSNFAYDNEGRLISTTDPLGSITRYSYDANGNRTQVTDAKNQITAFTYDALNRVTNIQDALGNTIQKTYDAAGRLAKETDPRGNVNQFTYDAVGNLTQVKDAAAGTAKYAYDKNQNRISQTDPNNKTSNLAYDKLNRLISSVNPLSHASSYTYDEVGNRLSQTDANGRTIRYAYDGNNSLSAITYADNSVVQFTRDANGNVTRMVDSLGTSTFVYDELNRVTSATDPFGKNIGYQYDGNGNITRLTYPDGKAVTYQFDANNRMVSLTDWASKTTTFQYDSTNLLTKVTYPNGIVATLTYDNAGRLVSKSDSGVGSYTFELDENGNRKRVIVTQPLGNRLYTNSQNYTYDAANRIQSAGSTTFVFDNNGNMTSKTEAGVVTGYLYDFENRLVSVGNISEYFYNGEGVRLQKIENGKTTRYVVDTNRDLSQVLCETDANGAITSYYVYGVGLAYKVDPNGTHYYYSFDPLGSTIAMTNDAGAVVNSYAYDPFGKVTNKTEGTANPFQYVGQYGVAQDANGLLFMRARYYLPEIGRFTATDPVLGPLTDTQTLNFYVYVANRVVGNTDPSGLSFWGGLGRSVANYTTNAVLAAANSLVLSGSTIAKGTGQTISTLGNIVSGNRFHALDRTNALLSEIQSGSAYNLLGNVAQMQGVSVSDDERWRMAAQLTTITDISHDVLTVYNLVRSAPGAVRGIGQLQNTINVNSFLTQAGYGARSNLIPMLQQLGLIGKTLYDTADSGVAISNLLRRITK